MSPGASVKIRQRAFSRLESSTPVLLLIAALVAPACGPDEWSPEGGLDGPGEGSPLLEGQPPNLVLFILDDLDETTPRPTGRNLR